MSYLLITISDFNYFYLTYNIALRHWAGKQFGMDAPIRGRNEIGPPSKQKLSLETG